MSADMVRCKGLVHVGLKHFVKGGKVYTRWWLRLGGVVDFLLSGCAIYGKGMKLIRGWKVCVHSSDKGAGFSCFRTRVRCTEFVQDGLYYVYTLAFEGR
jgi:hypothetical protein